MLGGIDILVFTGGIGQYAAPVRWEIAQNLAHLDVEIEPIRNTPGAAVISNDDACVVVRVIETNETLMIARHSFATLFASHETSIAE